LTSSAEFIAAIKVRDLVKAKEIADKYPWAVQACEPHNSQFSAVHLAVKKKDMELLEFLYTLKNVDFDMGDVDGERPLLYAVGSRSTSSLEMVKFLVEKGGADIQSRSLKNEWSPIYVAATLGNIETLKYMMSLGCDVNVMTAIKRTALTKVCWMGRVDSLKILLEHPQIDLEHKANSDRTALHMAVWGSYGGRHG